MSNYTKSTNFATKDNLTPGDPLKIVRGTEIDTEFNNIATAIATKTDNASAAITGGSITGITDLAIADGGTGASTATAAINNLLPSQTSNANKYLQTDGTNVSWDAVSLSTSDITGTLPVANGGTGVTSSTGTGSVVLSNSPTLVTPALGTPASGVATNLTGLPISTGVSGLGTGVATFLGTPSSANLASAVTDETGSGALVFANSPTLVTPALGTPSSATLTNATGLPISTGVSGLGTGVATFLATPSSANLASAVSDETGSGALVFANSPTLVTPALGTPSSGTLTNATGLPISTGVSGLGTGVATALAVNVGSAGAPVVNGGALGTPSSGTATNLTGLPLSTGVTGTLPTTNGGTGLTSFTSGGVVYASSTSALATGSALTYNGSTFKVAGTDAAIIAGFGGTTKGVRIETTATGTSIGGVDSAFVNSFEPLDINGSYTTYSTSGTERMRLTSTGLGIGTSSPSAKLHVYGSGQIGIIESSGNYGTSGSGYLRWRDVNGNAAYVGFGGNANNFDIYNALSGSITFSTSAGLKATLDSAGNLGLGVTPSAWSFGGNFDLGADENIFAGATSLGVGINAYYNAGWKYKGNGYASYLKQQAGQFQFWNASNNVSGAGATATFTQAMTLDASGKLLLGTTSSPNQQAVIYRTSATTSNGALLLDGNGNYAGVQFARSGTVEGSLCVDNATMYMTHGNAITFRTGSTANVGGTDRMVIDSSGNLLVGTTTATAKLTVDASTGDMLNLTTSGTSSGYVYTSASTTTSNAAFFIKNSSGVGSISCSSVATAYNTSSDYRLKNSVAPMTGALAKVALLKPCTYKWNVDGSDGEGFIAHELAEVCPHAVVGEKDAVDEEGNPKYQGIDTSFLVATLTAALQELNAKFDAYVASHP